MRGKAEAMQNQPSCEHLDTFVSLQGTSDIYEQLWQIIVRFNANSQRHIHLLQDIYHKENIRISVEQWIDQSVINQCLSDQLSSSEKDEDLLPQYYHGKSILMSCFFFFYCSLLLEKRHRVVDS
jgi:hypothetical protein